MMRVALDAARKAVASQDIPVGAAIFNNAGDLIATGHNERELHKDPTAHAEIVAIRNAAENLGDWHLTDHTLVVTLEPCAMCAGAGVLARIKKIIYGADDPKSGACGSIYNLANNKKLNHRIEVISGILRKECASLLKEFFNNKRER